ncbi:MAG TPA: DUF3037 domain-containing protein [Solirubrobacteraceae bacterium]|nr:DUF3037 domain-containing protein [Solirubrobacteraceae bacterium]
MSGASSRSPFSYLMLRAVPSVERGECVNVGVVLFCRQRGFLGARVTIDGTRLAALGDEGIDVPQLEEHLIALVRVAEGAPGAGPVAALEPSERFGWLAAPSSTIVQPSEVHTGLCDDPERMLDALHARLVG